MERWKSRWSFQRFKDPLVVTMNGVVDCHLSCGRWRMWKGRTDMIREVAVNSRIRHGGGRSRKGRRGILGYASICGRVFGNALLLERPLN